MGCSHLSRSIVGISRAVLARQVRGSQGGSKYFKIPAMAYSMYGFYITFTISARFVRM